MEEADPSKRLVIFRGVNVARVRSRARSTFIVGGIPPVGRFRAMMVMDVLYT